MVLSLGSFGLPLGVLVKGATTGVGPLTPGPSGPLVPTDPPLRDIEKTAPEGNYVRMMQYSWAFDPLVEADPNFDYYIVFISAAVQAKGDWCLADGRTFQTGLTTSLTPPSQLVRIEMQNGKILTDKTTPMNHAFGQELGSTTLSLGLDLGVKSESGVEASVSAGISWTQIIFDYVIGINSVNSTELIWQTTIHRPSSSPPSGLGVCNKEPWVWGYSFGLSVPEGQTPVIGVSVTGFFFKLNGCLPFCIYDIEPFTLPTGCAPYQNDICDPYSLTLPLAIKFETNPLVGSIVFNGTEFEHGQHAFYSPGTYNAAATPPDGYIFDHWETNYGGHGGPNPAVFNVAGNGFLRAVFAAKLTLLTDPPEIGSISIASSVGGQCGPGHPNGDWAYVSSLPPKSDGLVVVCANVPAGYAFDHWSSTGALSYQFKDNDTVSGFYLTGPSTMKAWFSPKTCCPGVIFNTNLNNNGGPALMGGSIFIGTQDVTNSRLYFARGRVIEPLAVPSEGYVFDHWDLSGLSLVLQDTECGPTCGYVGNNGSNPGLFNVTGTCCWYVTAHFALKITFETNPPGTGSISLEGCGPNYPGHQDGDWVLANPSLALYPPNTQTICANTPTGYKFDHWTTTSPITGNWERPVFAPYNSTTQVVIWMTPFVIKAWFTSLSNNSSTAPSVPRAPSSLVATGQYGRVDLSWNIPLSDGRAQITSYQIYRGNSFGSLSLLSSVGNQLWYQDTSVTNGQVYYYRVTAVNSPGEGPSSNTESARPGIDRITIAPDPRSVLTGGQVQFSAFATAESGEIIQGVSFSWTTSVPGASITNAGLFKAGTIIGTFTEEVSATAAAVNGYATVIVQAPPGTRASTASLPFDSFGPWTLALIPGAVAVAIGVLGVIIYRKKINRGLPKQS